MKQSFFGGSPNEDIFRFLQVGDAYFAKGSEVALRMIMGLNITTSNDLQPQKTEKPQIVEAINERIQSEFSIKISLSHYEKVRERGNIGGMPEDIQTLENLFKTINNHTEKLVKQEIKFLQDIFNF